MITYYVVVVFVAQSRLWLHYFHGNRCVKTNRAIGGLCPDRLMVATFSGFQRWSGKSQQKG